MQSAFVIQPWLPTLGVIGRSSARRAFEGILSLLVGILLGGCDAGPEAGPARASPPALAPSAAEIGTDRDPRRADPLGKGPYAARDANVEVFCTERGGDTYAGPAEQSAYLDPAWGESFRYFAHQPARGACEDAD